MVFKSLKTRFSVVLSAVSVLLALILFCVLWLVSTSMAEKNVVKNIGARQSFIDGEITTAVDKMMLIYSRITFDDTLNDMLDGDKDEEEKSALFEQMVGKIGLSDEIAGIACEIGGSVFYSQAVRQYPLDKAYLDEVYANDSSVTAGGVFASDRILPLGKKMVNYPVSTAAGAIVFYLKLDALAEISSVMEEGIGYSFIVSDKRTVIAHEGGGEGDTIYDAQFFFPEKGYAKREYEGEKKFIFYKDLSLLGRRYGLNWQVVTVAKVDVLLADLNTLSYIIIAICVAALGVSVVISLSVARKVTSPINRLSGRVQSFSRSGKKQKAAAKDAGDELYQLEKSYDEMVERILNMIDKMKQDMETQRKLELDSLQMQINPHFLYNTLDAIAWMAKLKKEPQIEKLVLALSKFFRISLHKGDRYISVEEEIELIRNFIEIELIRFPEKFEVEYAVEEGARNAVTPKLILQPIVENAIKHGISQIDASGHLKISVRAEGDDIVFEVEDNGIGFPTVKKEKSAVGGFGMYNVNERIKLIYGEGYGVTVDESFKNGARVSIRIKKELPATN